MNEPVNILQTYRIGAFDQRVQILAPTETQSSNSGEITQTWGEYATRYAQVIPQGGSEQILGDMIQPLSRARFVFRYDSTITEKFRLVWNSHTYNITSIEVIPRNRFLVINAESYSLSGSEGVDYGDYYSTNSLRVRIVEGSAVTNDTPSIAQINSDSGLTPASAGIGYFYIQKIKSSTNALNIFSDGTYWYRGGAGGFYNRVIS